MITINAGQTQSLQSVVEGTGAVTGWLWAEPSSSSPRSLAHFWASSCSRGSIAKRWLRAPGWGQTLQQGQIRRSCQPSLCLWPSSKAQPSSGWATAKIRLRTVSSCKSALR